MPADARRRFAALLVLTACVPASAPLAPPAPTSTPSGNVRPAGVVRVAYPEEPGGWDPRTTIEPAAADLAALWGVPLWRVDPEGQLAPGLVTDVDVLDPRTVRLQLGTGTFADGRPLTADDVAASIDLARTRGLLPGIDAVRVNGPDTVELAVAGEEVAWAWALTRVVVTPDGRELTGPPSVADSGGWFALVDYEPGLRATFSAHAAGPLGPPSVAQIELLFVPDADTALGLIGRGEVDVALGYLVVDPDHRPGALPVTVGAPTGGTLLTLEWSDAVEAAVRHGVAELLDRDELAGGLDVGEPATSVQPGSQGPWRRRAAGTVRGTVALVLPRGQEVPALIGQLLARRAQAAGAQLDLVVVEPEVAATRWQEYGDGVLRVHRLPPGGDPSRWPAGEEALWESGRVTPLLWLRVAHFWTGQGMSPSAWPGLGFWEVGRWTTALRSQVSPPAG